MLEWKSTVIAIVKPAAAPRRPRARPTKKYTIQIEARIARL